MTSQVFTRLLITFATLCFSIGHDAGQPEHVQHGAASSKFAVPHLEDMDHKAILGFIFKLFMLFKLK